MLKSLQIWRMVGGAVDGWGRTGRRGLISHAPISTQLQTLSGPAFVVAVVKKQREREANREGERERVRVPGGLGGGLQLTLLIAGRGQQCY